MFSGKDFTPAKIEEVQENSPAFVSGLKKNDVILSINNNKVKSILEVSTYINASTSDEIVTVTFPPSTTLFLFIDIEKLFEVISVSLSSV